MSIKKTMAVLSVSFVLILGFFGVTVFAEEVSDNKGVIPDGEYKLVITNEDTGEKEVVDVEEEDVELSMVEIEPFTMGLRNRFFTTNVDDEDEKFYMGSVKIDVTDTLNEIYSSGTQSGSTTGSGLLELSAGLTFSTNASNNTVKLYNVFGSAEHKGLYYVVSRDFYWRNPGSGSGSAMVPTSSTWNYTVSDNWGNYSSALPPYALTEAVADVSGMSGGAQRVSVIYELQP